MEKKKVPEKNSKKMTHQIKWNNTKKNKNKENSDPYRFPFC